MGQKLGEFIKTHREKSGLSQLDISDALGLKSAQYVSNIERGVSPLSRGMIQKVARAIKVDSEDLVDVILIELKEKYMKALKTPAKKPMAKKKTKGVRK
jgi:transcriptional regulator with XRE-family HTH domain